MKYQDYVTRAKNLLNQMECYQQKIAAMALKVCEIRHGGKSDQYYTITDFANDIGVNRKTLSNWVHIYRDVLLKCDIKTPTKKQWETASKVEKTLKSSRTSQNKTTNSPNSRTPYRKNIPKEEVKELFTNIQARNSEQYDLEKIFLSSRHNKGKLHSMDLSKCDENKLLYLMNILDEMSDYINDYLTENRKAS